MSSKITSAVAVCIATFAAGCATPGSDTPAQQPTGAVPLVARSAPLTEPARIGTRLKSGSSDRMVRTVDGQSIRLDTIQAVGSPAGVAQ